MKKLKTVGISILVAACAACLSLAFVACSGGEKSASYGAGEEGFYYYDGADSARYMLSLQSGTYMITANNETQYSGSYSYDEETGVVSFAGDASFTATMGESALSLDMTDVGYSFKAYRYFDVTYVDESGKEVATESVLNGQSATGLSVDKDGYWFVGWYEDSSNSSEFAFDTSIAGDTTVYGWYIEKNLTASEYVVTLDYGDGTTETEGTMNGAVYKSLPSSYNGSDILGWWVSATNKSEELTYKYNTGDVFTSDTTLFAVYGGMGASVTGSGITWENTTGSNVFISICDENGNEVLYANPQSSSKSYSSDEFAALSAGTYTVTVSSGSTTETLVYVVNGLARVSTSSVDIVVNGSGMVFSFAPVENASGYRITVTDGETTSTEELGGHTYYNFSNWDMTKEGITFTVTAYATGYVSSVSDSYTYRLVLDDVSVDIVDDEVVWNRVENAVEYLVTVKDVDGNVYETFTTPSTSYSLKYYGAGTYTISVQPVTDGCWSEASEYRQYSKVSLASPVITDITNYTVTWEGNDEAESYVVMINGVEYEVVGTTTLVFSSSDVPVDATFYEISVKAVGENDSSYSDVMTVTNGGFSSAVTYENGTVYWSYDVAATYYVVSVNGTDTTVSGGNSFDVTLNKAGDNEITVTAYDAKGSLGQATIDVYAYSVILDTNGATLVNDSAVGGVIYVAQGDAMNLGETYKDYADFVGWYTQADYTDGQSDEYEGKGSEVTDGTVFTGSRDMYLYAYWSYRYIDVTLVVGNGTFVGESDTTTEVTVKIKYNGTSATLPVAEPGEPTDDFMGWYTGSNGQGKQYTSDEGLWNANNPYSGEETLYAYYVDKVLSYSRTVYNGETVYAVSAGSKINLVSSVTIPTDYEGYGLIINSGAFNGCVGLEIINIPDTVKYISTVNDGYRRGTGAFAQCTYLKEVNIYVTEKTSEPTYFSEDGVLFRKMNSSDDAEILYYPYAKTTETYTIPSYVSNTNELDWNDTPVTHAVTTIPEMVFRDRSFKGVIIPTSVTRIESRAFYNNTSLTSVVFEDGGTATLIMDNEAFYSCPYVTTLTLPARYTNFDSEAISGFTSLENIYVETGSAYVSDSGVLLDAAGTKVLYFPAGRSGAVDTDTITTTAITSIGDGAFADNKKITSVTIGSGVTYIGTSAFDGCSGVTEITFKGDSDSSKLTIKSRAFYGCLLVAEIRLPANLTELGANAFGGCSNLSSVYFESYYGATSDEISFASNAFGSTNYITKVEFGQYVPLFDNFGDVFDGGRLSTVTVDTNNENYYADEYAVLYNADKTTILYYPRGREADSYTVLSTTEKIGSNVFAGRTYLKTVSLGASVNTIGDDAFSGCTSLVAIYVDSTNTNYGNTYNDGVADGILYEKDADTEELVKLIYCPISCAVSAIKTENTVVETAVDAFRDNKTVKSVVFTTEEDFELAEYTFYGASVESVILPETITFIPESAFYRCTGLVYVNFPDSVEWISDYAFSGCTSLLGDLSVGYVEGEKGIELNEGLESIGDQAFYNCKKLAVTIPSTVETIDDNAFNGCWSSFTSSADIVFASSEDDDEDPVELTIGEEAFNGTTYATGVTLPARLVELGSEAFHDFGSDADDETPVVFEEGCSIPAIDDWTFWGACNIVEVVIPGSVEELGFDAFGECESLESVTFGFEGETSELSYIGSCAFEMTALREICIPASVEEIDILAFSECWDLEVVTFEEGSQLENLWDSTFCETGIVEITLPGSLTYLDCFVFQDCYDLTTVNFGIGDEEVCLEYIGEGCFSYCESLESIEIPASVEIIDAYAFDFCESLEEVTFAEDSCLEEIGECAFEGCYSLTHFEFPESSESIYLDSEIFLEDELEYVYLSSSVEDLGGSLAGAYIEYIAVADEHEIYRTADDYQVLYTDTSIAYVCSEIEGGVLNIPDGILSIGGSAFSGHTELTSVTIPASVSSIGEYAFYGCRKLETVTIADGSSLTGSNALGSYAFYDCRALKSINLPEGITKIPSYCFYSCDLSETVVPESITNIGSRAFSGSSSVAPQITEMKLPSIEKIDTYAFRFVKTLTTIEFGNSLTEIGNYAFYGCTSLANIVLPNSLSKLGTYVFYECTSLVSVEIPYLVTSLGNYTFNGCTALEEVILPETLTSIGTYVFRYCESLVSCVLPDAVTEIGNYAFDGCVSLTNIVLPVSLTSIGTYCFRGCTALENIEFDSALTTIGTYAFSGCESLTSVVIGQSVTSLGTYAFDGCSSLVYVYTGQTLTSIPNYAFRNCTSLETVDFGLAVKSIGTSAFQSCESLTGVTFTSGLESIGKQAFSGCVSLEIVIIPSSVSSVSSSAFESCGCDVYINSSASYVASNWDSDWMGSGDTANTGAIYYYSETEPATDGGSDGNNYWHYDDDGEVVVW